MVTLTEQEYALNYLKYMVFELFGFKDLDKPKVYVLGGEVYRFIPSRGNGKEVTLEYKSFLFGFEVVYSNEELFLYSVYGLDRESVYLWRLFYSSAEKLGRYLDGEARINWQEGY